MRISTFLAALAAALLLAGCGGSDSGDSGEATSPGALDHVDGIVTVDGESLSVAPTKGGDAMTFELGPAVQVAELRAIEASGAPARVSFRPGEDPLTAASVRAAPKLGEGLETYEGTVESVSATELVVDGDDGERTFDVSGAEEGVFDVPHLEEHSSEGSPITVYFDPSAPDVGVAYEDA